MNMSIGSVVTATAFVCPMRDDRHSRFDEGTAPTHLMHWSKHG
jgi:hypothetical protein